MYHSRADTNPYAVARERLSIKHHLVGREKEKQEICRLIQEATNLKRGECVLLTGPTGVGKSLTVSVALDDAVSATKRRVIINLSAIQKTKRLILDIAEGLFSIDAATTREGAVSLLKAKLQKASAIVVLEEIDEKYYGADVKTLCDLTQSSRLILVGTGNSDNFQATVQFWKRIDFSCYTHTELLAIAEAKLMSRVLEERVFAKGALKLWSHRSAGIMGDYRTSVGPLIASIKSAENAGQLVSMKDVQTAFSANSCLAVLDALAPITKNLLETMIKKQREGQESFGGADVLTLYRDIYKCRECPLRPSDIIGAWQDIGTLEKLPFERYRIKAKFL